LDQLFPLARRGYPLPNWLLPRAKPVKNAFCSYDMWKYKTMASNEATV